MKNSNATRFVPKVARTMFTNRFATVCRNGTKTPGTDKKRAKHEFWGKRDDLGVKKKSNTTLFVPKVARTVFTNNFRTLCHMRTKTPGVRGMTWVLRKTQMQLFSYQKWLELSSRTVFAQFVVPEPKLLERTRNELNMSFWANRMTWGFRNIEMQLFSYQIWLELSS